MRCPITLWGQSRDWITVKIKVHDPQETYVNISDDVIEFRCKSEHLNKYEDFGFLLELYLPINAQESSYVVDSTVNIKLRKKYFETWRRLTFSTAKLAWLKPDFDSFEDSGLSEDGLEEQTKPEASSVNVTFAQPTPEERYQHEMEKAAQQADEEWEALLDLLKNPIVIYVLLLYIFQLAGSLSVLFTATTKHLNVSFVEHDLQSSFFDVVCDRFVVMQLVFMFEIVNVIFGIERSSHKSFLASKLISRNLVLFVGLFAHEKLRQNLEPSVSALLTCWALGDSFYYFTALLCIFGENWAFMRYMDHTGWLIYHPVVFMLEGTVLIHSLPFLYDNGRLSLNMPNALNISFSMPLLIQLYLLTSSAALYFGMQAFYRERKTVIGPRPTFGAEERGGLKGLLGSSYVDYWRNSIKSEERKPLRREQLIQNVNRPAVK